METIVPNPTLQSQKKRSLASVIQVVEDSAIKTNLVDLTSELSGDIPWSIRQAAARKLGNIGDSRALPKLIDTLPGDAFWMVRQAIIQALEKIGDVRAIPALEVVAENDSFAVVRSYAAKAIERILNT